MVSKRRPLPNRRASVIETIGVRPFYYLATGYSRYPYGKEAAHRIACRVAARLFEAGILVFAPIPHTHAIAVEGTLDGGFDQWEALDIAMMSASAGLIVVKMDGWAESDGITREIAWCKANGKPVIFMEEDGMPALDILARR